LRTRFIISSIWASVSIASLYLFLVWNLDS